MEMEISEYFSLFSSEPYVCDFGLFQIVALTQEVSEKFDNSSNNMKTMNPFWSCLFFAFFFALEFFLDEH